MKHLFKYQLKQGVGAPPSPVVKAGDMVKRGQVIAEADLTKLCVPLHASVNGVVKEVTETHIIVEQSDDNKDFVKIDQSGSIADVVRNAGLIGLGGAGFPAYVKLKTQLKPGGFLIVNAAECEPVLEHNMDQIVNETEKMIGGLRLAMESTGADHGIIGIKLKHKEEIKLIIKYLKDNKITDIRVLPLRNIYPVGEERALIRDTINVLLPPGALPSEANSVVFNVETLCAIYDAVNEGKPLIDKHLTVAGRLNDLPEHTVKTLTVPIGYAIDDIVADFGGLKLPIGEIVLGGPYTGKRAVEGAAVEKTTGGILVTQEFKPVKGKLGLIQCACGASKTRMEEVAASMSAEVVGHQICKNAHEANGNYKCENPGHCPGQAEKVLELRKLGAEEVLISHCTDCSNTVMGSAPKLKMEVHHMTDHVLETMGMPVIREFDETQL
ncbi:MAG: proline reductase-associated electron transfer protein PrdC [Tissierellia bacterium]|nr:proline reductase-associated electron transfer protein PrdC [Tissierellia bacterium]